MDEKPPRPMTPAQRRFLDAAERIRTDRPTSDDYACMARELVQVTLPHRNPGDVPAWSRTNGNLTMTIRPGWDARTEKPIGYPYGNVPRLLLFWLTAEAVRTRTPRIELGSSLADFMFQLGMDSVGRGPRSDAHRLRDQMERLFQATISFDRTVTEGGRTGTIWLNMPVTSGGEVWWSPRDPTQAALWGSWIELGEKFFQAITAHPVPLDMRALKALKRSPLALDLYAWLCYEAYRAHKSGKGRFVAWQLLMQQLGTDYADARDFRRYASASLRKVQALYPGLKLGPMRGGVRIEPDSLPAITPQPAQPSRRQARTTDSSPTPLATSNQFAELRRELSGEAQPVTTDPPLVLDLVQFRCDIAREPEPISLDELPIAMSETLEVLRRLFLAATSDVTLTEASKAAALAQELEQTHRLFAARESRFATPGDAWDQVRQKLHELRAAIDEVQNKAQQMIEEAQSPADPPARA